MAERENSYDCLYTEEGIKVDGLLDEPVWQKAGNLDFFIPVSHEKPLSKTEGKLLWDKDYLYVGFRAYDEDIWSYQKNRDDPTCLEDVLEVFLKTDPRKEPYYNFEINALGTVYDAFNLRRENYQYDTSDDKRRTAGGDHRWSKWDCRGLKLGIKIKGTLNNWEDKDEYWQLEIAIPFRDLATLKGKIPEPGDSWLFHLSRYDYSLYLPEGVELSSSSRLSEVNFHRYEDWQTLKFVK